VKALKILIFNWRCPKHPQAGGAEKATYEIARRWVQQGHKVQLISGGYVGGSKYDNIDGINIVRLGGKYSVYIKSIFYYFTRFKGKYDIIIDEINTIPFFTPLFVREPHVAFIHQLAANVLFEELSPVQAKFLSFLEPHVLRLYRNMSIITSKSTKYDLLRLGITGHNMHVINYGVDQNIYKPSAKKSVYPDVFYLGRLKRFKGVHLLIKAMSQVVEEIPTAKLSIVGSGDADYVAELKQMVSDLNLSKNVVFFELGIHNSLIKKVQIMQKAWVLVFPSAREGFGLVVVESNSCGTPTIATDVPGLRETVRDNDTGFLVARNVDTIARSINQVLIDDVLRARLSERSLEWSKQFDWNKTADNMLKVLESAINNNNRKKL
jgi:glycosyltransferase involved in cell wall biosynthesis